MLVGKASEVMNAIKEDTRNAKAGRLFWTGVGLYSINMIVKHTHRLGMMKANKDYIEWVEEKNEESGE